MDHDVVAALCLQRERDAKRVQDLVGPGASGDYYLGKAVVTDICDHAIAAALPRNQLHRALVQKRASCLLKKVGEGLHQT